METVDVLVSDAAGEFIRSRGGTLFVRARPHRCCGGPLTLLDATTDAPGDVAAFEPVTTDAVDVRFCGGSSGRPDRLVVELRGLRKRHPVAYWDGCAYKP
jgi:hypothetical protein